MSSYSDIGQRNRDGAIISRLRFRLLLFDAFEDKRYGCQAGHACNPFTCTMTPGLMRGSEMRHVIGVVILIVVINEPLTSLTVPCLRTDIIDAHKCATHGIVHASWKDEAQRSELSERGSSWSFSATLSQ
jgi:hypothetical protein